MLNAVSLLYSANAKVEVDFSYVTYGNYSSIYNQSKDMPYAIAGYLATNSQVPAALLEQFLKTKNI